MVDDVTQAGLAGLSRYNSKGTTGWFARFYAQDRVVQKLFSDARYGWDPEASLAAARRWLLGCLDTLEPRPRYRRTTLPTNRTGRVGVCLRRKTERNGRVVWVYDVSYTLAGKRYTTSFRVHLYASQQEAFRAATACRAQMERAMRAERRQALRQAWHQEQTT
jgi:hypothetical protein